MTFNTLWLMIALSCVAFGASYPICDGKPPSLALKELRDDYIDRLLPANNSAVMISIQLTDQSRFYTLNQQISALETRVQQCTNATKLGALSYHLMAVLSTCNDPKTFSEVNLQELIQQRFENQFYYRNRPQRLAFDGWYQYGLALQASCVSGADVDMSVICKALQGQEENGGWAYGVDETSQMVLGLLCVKNQQNVANNATHLALLNSAIQSAIYYLESSVRIEGENTFIGNRYSAPEALLALNEASKVMNVNLSFCNATATTLLTPLTDDDQIASIYQRLPVISGKSVLTLKESWTCAAPETTTAPSTTATTTTTTVPAPKCEDYSQIEEDVVYITVTLLVIETLGEPYTGPYDYSQVVVNVANGTKLVEVMFQAKCTGNFKYETKMTTWGASVRSVNGLTARGDQREYWSLRDGATGSSYSTGASSYVPKDNDLVLFKLSTW